MAVGRAGNGGGGGNATAATPITAPSPSRSKTPRAGKSPKGKAGKEKSVIMAETIPEQEAVTDKKPARVRVMDQRASPVQMRKGASENYEEPMSGREGWWRCHIRETPNPGTYESPYFLNEVLSRANTYSFKSDGRRLEPQPQIGKGQYLLPGAYEHEDFAKRIERSKTTYSFKATGRDKRDFLNFGKKDRDINVCPTAYSIEKVQSLSVEKQPSRFFVGPHGDMMRVMVDERHWQFKSQAHRFPTVYFTPKEGPAPGNYEYLPPSPDKPVRSAFLSKTPRFSTSHTKVPGPGAYEKTFQAPMPKTIMKMGRNHGLFFSSAFQA